MIKSMEEVKVVKGYVVPLPRSGRDELAARVAVTEGDVEYHIVPRGAGVDLGSHINAHVEVEGLVRETDGALLMQVRTYRLDDAFEHEWYDDNDEEEH